MINAWVKGESGEKLLQHFRAIGLIRTGKDRLDYMGQRDAEIAIGIQLHNENPEMTDKQAMAAAEEFVRKGRHVNVKVDKDGRKGNYWGVDPYDPSSKER